MLEGDPSVLCTDVLSGLCDCTGQEPRLLLLSGAPASSQRGLGVSEASARPPGLLCQTDLLQIDV